MFSDFAHVGCFNLEGLFNLFDLLDDIPQILYLFDPFVNMDLILVNVCLDNRNIIDYLLRVLRHDGDLFYQLCLLFHVQLFEVQYEFVFVEKQFLTRMLQFLGDLDQIIVCSLLFVLFVLSSDASGCPAHPTNRYKCQSN